VPSARARGGGAVLDTLLQDLKQALRLFRDHPGFTATTLLALTLGIGINTAIFSVVNDVLLKPLPYPDSDRLVALLHAENGAPTKIFASQAHFTHWQAQRESFEHVAAWRTVSFDYMEGDMPASVTAGTVSDAYFDALGATFVAGRAPAPDEHVAGAAKVVVVSHRFWLRRLGGDAAALGSTLPLNGVPHTIVGITGLSFDVGGIDVRGFGVPEIWVPLQIDPNVTDFSVTLDVFARLRDGVSLEAAQQRLAASIGAYRERYPEDTADWQFTALGMQEALVGASRPMLLVLTGAVALVLLVACANVANLLLVRAVSRAREVAIRATLGAGRARIARQLLTESLVLTLSGGVLGLAAALAGVRWLRSSDLVELPRLTDSTALLVLDWRVLAFTAALAIVTGLVFGLVPALAATRTDLCSVMKDSTNRAAGGRRQTKTQSLLVTVEVALAVVLVVGAGLLIRTSFAISAVDLGFGVNGVLTMRGPSTDPTRPTSAVVATNERALARLRTIPGIESAAASVGAPLEHALIGPFDIVGRQNAGSSTGTAFAVPGSTGYFETLGIRLVRGRLFDAADNRGAAPVAVIDEAMADLYWANGRDPFDEKLRFGGTVPEAADEPARQIIGIVTNVRQQGIFVEPHPTIYFPHAQLSDGLGRIATLPIAWLVRTSVPPQSVSSAVQQALREETGQLVTEIKLLESTWLESIATQRLNLTLMTLFGAAALLLGAVGVYGLVAHSVEYRQHEIGIRLAVGARPGSVQCMVVREGMLRVLAGVGIGVVAAYFLANVLAALLYGVEPHDAVVFVTVPFVLATVGFVAVYVPALRATRVDPTLALRAI
jgi:putative ABC transport system permease protein